MTTPTEAAAVLVAHETPQEWSDSRIYQELDRLQPTVAYLIAVSVCKQLRADMQARIAILEAEVERLQGSDSVAGLVQNPGVLIAASRLDGVYCYLYRIGDKWCVRGERPPGTEYDDEAAAVRAFREAAGLTEVKA